jgi:putative heme-binding domain-containing protein
LPRVAELAVSPNAGRGGRGGGRGGAATTDTANLTPYDRALQQVIRGGVAGTEMPSHRLQPEELRVLALFVKSLGQLAPETVPGDPVKGAELYKTKGQCATCHTLRGQGAAIGPDLTEIGRKRSAIYLRKALAEPSADVPQSYNAYRGDISLPLNFLFIRAKTKDGKDIAGIRINEDTFSVQIRDLTGRIHSYFKSELVEYHKDYGQSPMPVYTGVFTPEEMTDVIAFLASLRGTTPR